MIKLFLKNNKIEQILQQQIPLPLLCYDLTSIIKLLYNI